MQAWMFPGQGLSSDETQVGIFQTCYEGFLARLETGDRPDMLTGHSLGMYTAYCAAGVFDYDTSITLLKERQALMKTACLMTPGSMMAVFGMDKDALADLCNEVRRVEACVQIANYNCPGQLVISGTVQAVARVAQLLPGGTKTRMLKVAGAFHSLLMSEANTHFARFIDQVIFSVPKIKLFSSVSRREVMDADEAKQLLLIHMTNPVHFEETIRRMKERGATEFYEIGPSKVLTGMVNRII